VKTEDGHPLPPLRNRETVNILATALSARLDGSIHRGLSQALAESRFDADTRSVVNEAWETWENSLEPQLYRAIARIIADAPDSATRTYGAVCADIENLCRESKTSSVFLGALLCDQAWFWALLHPLQFSSHVLVPYPLTAVDWRELHQVEISYTGSWRTELRDRLTAGLPTMQPELPPVSRVGALIRHLLERGRKDENWRANVALGTGTVLRLGLRQALVRLMCFAGVVGTPFRLFNLNAGHCKSYYVLLHLPPDVRCTRLYWTAAETMVERPEAIAVQSGYEHLASEPLPMNLRREAREAMAELQLSNSVPVSMLAALAFLLAMVCGYFARNPILPSPAAARHLSAPELNSYRQVAAATGALVVAAPATLTAVLLTQSSSLCAYLTRGTRVLSGFGAVAGILAALAIAVLLPKDRGTYDNLLLTSATINWGAGLTILAAIVGQNTLVARLDQWRVRRTTRSGAVGLHRPRRARRNGSPADCRYRQRRLAALGGVACLISTDVWWHGLRLSRQYHLLQPSNFSHSLPRLWETMWTARVAETIGDGTTTVVTNLSDFQQPLHPIAVLLAGVLVVGSALVLLALVGRSARQRLVPAAQRRPGLAPNAGSST
jgi:hypothetical protein